MPVRFVRAFAPATVANVGPGFDVFGFALEGPGDVVELRRTSSRRVRLAEVLGDGGRLPRGVGANVASAVVRNVCRAAGARCGADVRLIKGLPLGSGLGSSSASAVAAAVAANALLGRPFSPLEVLEFARQGEAVACGSAHADNVAPALFGGFTLVRGPEPLEVVRIGPPGWFVAVAHPRLELRTKKARQILPRRVGLADLTGNVGNAAAMVAALYDDDIRLFGRALMGETVVEPARARLIAGYDEVREAALDAGAAGAAISGAGPSMFALAGSRAVAAKAAGRMAAAWKRLGIASDIIISRLGASGARINSSR